MKRLLLLILILLLIPFPVNAATYNFYFSDDATGNAAGNDTTGDGSIGTPWKTLNKAQWAIETYASASNTVNLFFDRSDTWDASAANMCNLTWPYTSSGALCSDWGTGIDAVLVLRKGVVNIDAYGTGALPVFDGGVTDWETSDPANTPVNVDYVNLLWICYDNITVQNIKLYRIPHGGVQIKKTLADNITIRNVIVDSAGQEGINSHNLSSVINSTIENCTVTETNKRRQYGWTSGWGAAISLDSVSNSLSKKYYYNNLIRYNWVYNNWGEGIIAGASTGGGPVIVEKNLLGDSKSTALLTHVSCYDAGHLIARYNKLYATVAGKATYGSTWGLGAGVKEVCTVDYLGTPLDNSAGLYEHYGNIMINTGVGIVIQPDMNGVGNDYLGELRIFNNTAIDSQAACVYNGWSNNRVDAGFFYNNACIYYDQSGGNHIAETGTSYTNWTISNNFYWDNLAGSYGVVDGDWDTNYKTGNPLLPGEPSINWDGLAANTTIDFDTHLVPPGNSPLNTGGNNHAWEKTLLTTGTDFNDLPGTETFTTGEQTVEIGAILYSTADTTPPTTVSSGPSETIPFTTTTQITHNISENGTCKYDAADTTYDLMASTMDGAGGTNHSKTVAVVEDLNTFYSRCQDTTENKQTSSTEITFTVQTEESPSSPSPTAIGAGISGTFSIQ